MDSGAVFVEMEVDSVHRTEKMRQIQADTETDRGKTEKKRRGEKTRGKEKR